MAFYLSWLTQRSQVHPIHSSQGTRVYLIIPPVETDPLFSENPNLSYLCFSGNQGLPYSPFSGKFVPLVLFKKPDLFSPFLRNPRLVPSAVISRMCAVHCNTALASFDRVLYHTHLKPESFLLVIGCHRGPFQQIAGRRFAAKVVKKGRRGGANRRECEYLACFSSRPLRELLT